MAREVCARSRALLADLAVTEDGIAAGMDRLARSAAAGGRLADAQRLRRHAVAAREQAVRLRARSRDGGDPAQDFGSAVPGPAPVVRSDGG
jgi:hypothetical protein